MPIEMAKVARQRARWLVLTKTGPACPLPHFEPQQGRNAPGPSRLSSKARVLLFWMAYPSPQAIHQDLEGEGEEGLNDIHRAPEKSTSLRYTDTYICIAT
jgi:hypothetical protein